MDIQDVLDEAVSDAKDAFEREDEAESFTLDAGHCMIKGLDGRTKAVKAMHDHPDINVSRSDYHGTTADLAVCTGQSTSKKKSAMWRFIDRMTEDGHLDDAWVWVHLT